VLSADMDAAVLKTAGPAGMAATKRANDFYKQGMDKIEKVYQPILDKKIPQQAWSALMSGTKEGATVLRTTLQGLDAEGQGLVRSNMMRRLGQMDDGSFSPELYLRSLNKLAPTSQAAMFEGTGKFGEQSLALAKIADLRRQQGRVMFNPSGTAQNVAFHGIVNGLAGLAKTAIAGAPAGAAAGGAIGGPIGAAVGAAVGPIGTAIAAHQLAERVFTNPRMVNWMVRQTRIPFGAMNQEIAILAKDAQKWGPADKETAMEFVKAMTSMDWRSILLGQAAADATAQRR
jgi:hypothetical protein